jgi:hypothetical protein
VTCEKWVELLGQYSKWTFSEKQAHTAARAIASTPTPDPLPHARALRLGEDKITELVERYQAGATVYELADQFKIYRTTVSEHLHRRGVKMRGQGLDESEIAQAVQLYEQGWSVARIGERLGANASTVWMALHTLVSMRDTHGRKKAAN